jgi:hypothetical protein
MPRLTDCEVRKKIRIAFRERTSNGVQWKQVAAEWVRKNLGITTQALDTLIHEHLEKGGGVQQVKETRSEYRHWQYHYDFHIPLHSKTVYVETVLADRKMGPVVTVVSAHFTRDTI